MNTPLGLKIQNDYQIHHHHHLGQNRLHQKDNYSPTWAPPQPVEPYCHFLSGSEGIIRPPLPRLLPEKVPTVEQLLYSRCNKNECTANRKTNMVNQSSLNIIYLEIVF